MLCDQTGGSVRGSTGQPEWEYKRQERKIESSVSKILEEAGVPAIL